MAETVDEICIDFEDEGELKIEQLDKVVLTKGAWTTILFRYRERDAKKDAWGPAKATIKRYQKHQGVYKKRDSVNLAAPVARQLIETLTEWLDAGLLETPEKPPKGE
ncbi:MAG: hypothetical protein LBP95_05940 [Deltaproteobacteria bacterium]|jgi:hypothetical protein|nr:hypothetical protein [Deltaproteobacteria bacterium]MDR1297912.1 hypothetical protein [Deltaproteobacteria bacterium]